MISVDKENVLYGMKMSSVVPAKVTGETAIHELTNMDLAMKLHYLRAVYFYKKEAMEGLNIFALKDPMFDWLNVYCSAAGRVRRSDSGRPYIKCNDSGVRVVEATAKLTLDEWMGLKDFSLNKILVSDKALGPELLFSPLVILQLTKFKCGGVALGFSWAHVLGDAFTASKFINLWTQLLVGSSLPQTIHLPRTIARKPEKTTVSARKPASARAVEPVGDLWITASSCKMETHCFHFTEAQLKHLSSKISSQILPFEAISALIWQCIAKIREESEPQIVTVCRNSNNKREIGVLSNDQTISTIQADINVAKAELSDLAKLISDNTKDESKEIEAMIDSDNGMPDLIIYGANLTFINLEENGLYELEFKGNKPVEAYLTVDGIGENGVVLMLREPQSGTKASGGGDGRAVTVVLPENEISQLRDALERHLSFA